MNATRLKALCGPLSVLLFGLIFLGVGVGLLWNEDRYARDGVEVEANVTLKRVAQRSNSSSSGSRTSTTYEVSYAFQGPDGDTVHGEGQISFATWEALSPGSPLPVVYLRSDPSASRPVEEAGSAFPWIFAGVGGVLTLAGVGLTAHGLRRRG